MQQSYPTFPYLNSFSTEGVADGPEL